MAELKPGEQLAMASLFAGGGLTLQQIAAGNGISRSRVGQLRRQAITKLQQRIAQDPRWRELLAA